MSKQEIPKSQSEGNNIAKKTHTCSCKFSGTTVVMNLHFKEAWEIITNEKGRFSRIEKHGHTLKGVEQN